MNDIGLKLKKIRKSKKLTQKELASNIVNRSYISQIESGKIQPSYNILEKLCEKLECDIKKEFFYDDEPLEELELHKKLLKLESAVVNKNFRKSIKLFDELKLYEHLFTPIQQAMYFYCLGNLEESKNKLLSSIDYYHKSYLLYNPKDSLNKKIRSLNALVNVYLILNKVHEVFEYLNKSYLRTEFESIEEKERIYFLINLGTAHAKLNENHSAIRYLEQAIEQSKITKIYFHSGKAYMVLGLCYKRIDKFERAENAYNKSLFFLSEDNDLLNIAGTYLNIAILYRSQIDYQNAIKSLELAYSIYDEINDIRGILNSLYEFGVTYLRSDNLNMVYKVYSEFSEKYLSHEDYYNLKEKFLLVLGEAYLKEKKLSEAKDIYYKVLKITADKETIRDLKLKLSYIFSLNNDEEKLIDFWKNIVAENKIH